MMNWLKNDIKKEYLIISFMITDHFHLRTNML